MELYQTDGLQPKDPFAEKKISDVYRKWRKSGNSRRGRNLEHGIEKTGWTEGRENKTVLFKRRRFSYKYWKTTNEETELKRRRFSAIDRNGERQTTERKLDPVVSMAEITKRRNPNETAAPFL